MDKQEEEEFESELDALRDQSNIVQHWVVDVMNLSDDEELHDLVNDLGDTLDEVKSQINLVRNWFY